MHRLECCLTQRFMKNTSKFLYESTNLPDKTILDKISRYDAAETLGLPGKWPRSYSSEVSTCPLCRTALPPLTKRRQRLQTDKKLIISKLHIIEVEVYTRKCKSCCILIRPDTLHHGLLNIGDVTLVTLDIFFLLRNTVR